MGTGSSTPRDREFQEFKKKQLDRLEEEYAKFKESIKKGEKPSESSHCRFNS